MAVVGHANTGKTSLIRTLLRDTQFGEVADYAGTTRHVEAAQLSIGTEKLIEIFDTPGLEDSVALNQFWQAQHFDAALTNNQKMAAFIEKLDAKPEFAQEQKVLRQAFKSDVLLYVIDAREPYLGKYRDEIDLLIATARPIVPVLNFISADEENKNQWRERLIDHGLHAVVEYDTVVFTMEAERRLFEKLQSLAEAHYQIFERVIEHNASEYAARCIAAAKAIAEQYINVAAYRITVTASNLAASTPKVQKLVRRAEQKTVDQLLSIFGFGQNDVRNEFLPVENGKWELDLFDAQTYKQFGLQASSGAAKGAAVGAGIDLFVGGVSLGAGAAIGAVAGVIWSSLRKYGGSIKNTLTGSSYVCVDDPTVNLFFLRQRYLLRSLMARGHAAQEVVAAKDNNHNEANEQLSQLTRRVRDNHKWSNLDNPFAGYMGDGDKSRLDIRDQLTELLLEDREAEY
jgi:GTPase Era involved in 16S rRNA processing